MRQATEATEPPAAPTRILTGTVIAGRFRVESLQGREGGTVVYRATDTQSGAPLAVRLVPISLVVHDVDRLLAMVERTQALRHKNLVDVEAVGREGDTLFVATELVDGQTLRDFIDGKRAEGRGVSLKGACNLVAHVANALDYAKRMTAHGALSPAIIWVNRTGRVKVSALGLAAGIPGLARHGAPSGALETVYMAPEVIVGGEPTTTSDVYSLGVILYELLTGHTPSSPALPPSAVMPEIPAAVDAVIDRALKADPDARWPSATAMKEALQGAATQAPPGGDVHAASANGNPARRPAASSPAPSEMPRLAAGPNRPNLAAVAPTAAAGSGAQLASPSNEKAPTQAPAQHGPAPGVDPRSRSPLMVPVPAAADNVERWLVQKDRLDFGPFSMTQLRAQIERGEVLGEHLLIDNDSGARCRVKEYPGLGDLAKRAHRHLEQTRRAQAEQQSAKSEKKKSFATRLIVGVVLLSVLGGVAVYVISRRDTTGGRLASREEEAEIESFLKGVKIGGLKASVRRGGGHRAAGAPSGGAAEDFNNDATFGDASKGFAEGDQTLDDDQIQNTMMANYRKLIPCIVHSGVNEISMEFVVRGTGKVSAVKANGQRTGSLPGCLLGRMQSFNFPKFNGSKTIASWSMSMGR